VREFYICSYVHLPPLLCTYLEDVWSLRNLHFMNMCGIRGMYFNTLYKLHLPSSWDIETWWNENVFSHGNYSSRIGKYLTLIFLSLLSLSEMRTPTEWIGGEKKSCYLACGKIYGAKKSHLSQNIMCWELWKYYEAGLSVEKKKGEGFFNSHGFYEKSFEFSARSFAN
jgi:hypothetical protein